MHLIRGHERSKTKRAQKPLSHRGGIIQTIDVPFSACHVTETVMNEWCAYQEYLEWKILDTYRSEKIFEEISIEDFNKEARVQEFRHTTEQNKAKKSSL